MAGFERYSLCVCKLSDVTSLDLCTRLAAGGQTNGWCREGYWVSLPSALPSIACRQLGPREEGGWGGGGHSVRGGQKQRKHKDDRRTAHHSCSHTGTRNEEFGGSGKGRVWPNG